MSYKWPNKDPDEQLDYSVDWSRFLRSPATIQSVEWYVDDSAGVKTLFTPVNTVYGLQAVSTTNTNTVATIFLALGTNNVVYKLYCRMTDTENRIAERVILLPIKER